jgi:DNA-directed RNA polymerase subunit beta
MVKGENAAAPGIPEAFNVLVKELQGIGLQIDVLSEKPNEKIPVAREETSTAGETPPPEELNKNQIPISR